MKKPFDINVYLFNLLMDKFKKKIEEQQQRKKERNSEILVQILQLFATATIWIQQPSYHIKLELCLLTNTEKAFLS